MISQPDQAAEAYQPGYGAYPPGDGTGARALAEALTRPGPGKRLYFEFPADLLTKDGDVLNPVRADGDSAVGRIYYRLNAKRSQIQPGGDEGRRPPPQRKSKFDLWCAGCDHAVADPKTRWSINNG